MFVEPSGVQGSACTRQPMDTLEQSGDTALEYVAMWQRHASRSCTCGVCLCKSAHSLAPVFTGTTVCVSCLLNRSKSVRNEGEALIHCSSNTTSVRLRLCSKFLAAKRLSYFLTDEPGRTISRTPSADGMDELIESTSIDPMGPLTDQQRAEREEIYKQHALESDDTEDSEQDAQEARV